MSIITEMCSWPSDVRDSVCEMNVEHHKRGYPGFDADALAAVTRNDEDEIEGWCQDMVSRLGLDEDTVYYFQEVMMRWRDE